MRGPQFSGQVPNAMQHSYGHPQVQPTGFNYDAYMQQLSQKLGDYTLFSGRESASAPRHYRQGSYGSQPEYAENQATAANGGAFGNSGATFEGGNELKASQMSPAYAAFSPVQNQRLMGTGEFADGGRGLLSSVTKSGRGFREKILAQLGNAQLDDSKFNSNSEHELEATASLGFHPTGSHVQPPRDTKIFANSTVLEDL